MEKDKEDHPQGTTPVRLAFRVSYLGTGFFGSQIQEKDRTVEGEIIAACQLLSLFSDWREAGFQSAGRTDRGVHAAGQVIAFSTRVPDRAISTINSRLPADCWCVGHAIVSESFNPRYDARSRTYRYYFHNPDLDIRAMDAAAKLFIGTHNFTNFARVQDRNPYRNVIAARVFSDAKFICFEVTAESFLWHQVRSMAAVLEDIGSGCAEPECIIPLLESASQRPIQPSPAEGLVLWNIDCGICWMPVPEGKKSGAFIEARLRHYVTMEKICKVLRGHEDVF